MPPKITRVRWKADNIPYGLEFNENTGIFTGTPEDEGKHVVPVTVETNYGTDTKNIVISVLQSYQFYFITKHSTSNSIRIKTVTIQNNSADTGYLFAKKNIPKFIKLLDWPYGFRAIGEDGNRYGTGLDALKPISFSGIYSDTGNVPNLLYYSKEFTPLSDAYMICGYETAVFPQKNIKYLSDTMIPKLYYVARVDAQNKLRLSWYGDYYYHDYNARTWSNVKNVSHFYGSDLSGKIVSDVQVMPDGVVSCLLEDGTQLGINSASITQSDEWYSATGTRNAQTIDIGYRATKIFYCTSNLASSSTTVPASINVVLLSESNLLNNDPTLFTYGNIANVWGYDTLFYVQTTDNRLYEHNVNTNDWDLLGIFDIKKVIVDKQGIFMLTNDGKLYNKGKYGAYMLDEPHETLTQILPELTFKDFTHSTVRNDLRKNYGDILTLLTY